MSADQKGTNSTTIASVREAIISEFERQAPKVYFWDRADNGLFAGGRPEWSTYLDRTGTAEVSLADRFDMDAVAKAAVEAVNV